MRSGKPGDYPGIEEGVAEMRFLEAIVANAVGVVLLAAVVGAVIDPEMFGTVLCEIYDLAKENGCCAVCC